MLQTSTVEASVAEFEPEFELNQFFDDDEHISAWLEEQGVRGDQEIQRLQDRGV